MCVCVQDYLLYKGIALSYSHLRHVLLLFFWEGNLGWGIETVENKTGHNRARTGAATGNSQRYKA